MNIEQFKKELKHLEKIEKEVHLRRKMLYDNCPHEYVLSSYSIYDSNIELTYYCKICYDLKVEQRQIKDIGKDEKDIHQMIEKDGYKILKNEIVKVFKFV
jgi:hypothetical protein